MMVDHDWMQITGIVLHVYGSGPSFAVSSTLSPLIEDCCKLGQSEGVRVSAR
jgi:hypothetical protein